MRVLENVGTLNNRVLCIREVPNILFRPSVSVKEEVAQEKVRSLVMPVWVYRLGYGLCSGRKLRPRLPHLYAIVVICSYIDEAFQA